MSGGCYCGNIRFEMRISKPIADYSPRACDCEFCAKHGAAYLSDSKGHLLIRIKAQSDLERYQQGSGQASFLLCRVCGVLVAVCHTDNEMTYGAVNTRSLDDLSVIQEPVSASPKQLAPDARAARWKALWFSNVELEIKND